SRASSSPTRTIRTRSPTSGSTSTSTGSDRPALIALVPLRLVLGAIFVVHGYLKLFSRSYGPAQFRKYLAGEKVPFPTQTGLAIGVLEFAAGFCLLAGVYAREEAEAEARERRGLGHKLRVSDHRVVATVLEAGEVRRRAGGHVWREGELPEDIRFRAGAEAAEAVRVQVRPEGPVDHVSQELS